MNSDKPHILYVDDEENNLVALKAAFRRYYQIHTAKSAREGIAILKQHPVELIVTDQRMPEMTGVQFLEAVIPDYPDAIRMVLTGFSDVEAIIKAINTGRVFRYITKPWDEQELKMTIDGALSLFREQQENRTPMNLRQHKPDILYVDDEEHNLMSFHATFRRSYTIHTATSAREGMQILRQQPIQLVITDQRMPEMTGVDFLAAILPDYPDVIRIVLTGFSEIEAIIKAINSGQVYRYVSKPWDEKDLKITIDKALEQYHLVQENKELVGDLQYILGEMDFMHEIARRILTIKTLPELLNDIMESSKMLMHAEASSLLLYDEEDAQLHFLVARGDKGQMVKQYSVDVGSGIAGWVAEQRESLVVPDCYADSRFNPEYDQMTNFRTRSMICVPMLRDDRLLGVLQVLNKENEEVFDARDLKIFETLASQCAVAIENAKLLEVQVAAEALDRELQTARTIQQRLLPASLPDFEDIRVAAKLIPARQVGGDYYNVHRLNENQTLLMTADVTGKGIPAAMIVSTVYSCVHSYITQDPFRLEELVIGLNDVLLDSTTNDKFVTCWLGLYDHAERRLQSINAGHNPPYLFRNGEQKPSELRVGGMFLGCFEMPYESEVIQMQTDDVLVFYSDGVTEALNHNSEEYEDHRLIGTVAGVRDAHAGDILRTIEEDVQHHVDGAQQSDDFTCAVMKVL